MSTQFDTADAVASAGAQYLLDVQDLQVSFSTLRGRVNALDGVTFGVGEREIVGVVGESGSGKSVTALSILRLLGEQGRIDAGRIRLAGRDLTALTDQEMLGVRGRDVSMIFQEPMTSLNPVYTVGFQVAEVLIEHLGLRTRDAMARAGELLASVGIPGAERRVSSYPHQLSGGMRQRVMIAMALACRPQLLIADEPTTALDVTIQAQILDLMRELRAQLGTAVVIITHDMGVIADMAERVVVMYAGQIVEEAPVRALFEAPLHPYTRLLLRSIPLVSVKQAQLPVIEGATPPPNAYPAGCRFNPRCPFVIDRCTRDSPRLDSLGDGRRVRCWRAGDAALDAGGQP